MICQPPCACTAEPLQDQHAAWLQLPWLGYELKRTVPRSGGTAAARMIGCCKERLRYSADGSTPTSRYPYTIRADMSLYGAALADTAAT
jgi:hypothetical protein